MLSTKSKIQLLSILLNDIKNDVSHYSNETTFESLSVFEGDGKPLLRLLDNNGNEIHLSFNEKGKLEANTGNESKDKAIERKYKINWLLKSLSVLLFLLMYNISTIQAQCIHLYQCDYCGQNSRGSSSPSNGKYCSGRGNNTSRGHYWKDQGEDDPECERLRAAKRLEENKMLAECEKRKIKTYKGGTVIGWYCPSGKPSEVKYSNGIVEEYESNGMLSKKTTPKGNTFNEENYENGKLISKGNYLDSYNLNKDGEWWYKEFDYGTDNKCQNCFVVFKGGEFIGIGTLKELEEKKKNRGF